jgi:protein disulfide-isomerase A1
VTPASLEKFIDDYEAMLLPRYYKSDDVPETNDVLVKVVVRKSYDELVLQSEESVCIMFYQATCSHCQRFTPIFQNVA